MSPALRAAAVRVAAVAGLAISAAMLVPALSNGALCTSEGCTDVTASAWGRPLGVPLPAAGAGFFLALLTLSHLPRLVGVLRLLAIIGGVVGLGLIAVQVFVLGRVCSLCLVIDLLAITAALAAPADAPPAGVGWAWAGLAALAAAGGAAYPLWEASRPPPPEVLALRHADKVTVVELVDMNCRHCRHIHAALNVLEREGGGRMHRVQLEVRSGQEAWVGEAAKGGLPAVWVGRRLFRGAASLDDLRAAFRAEKSRLPAPDDGGGQRGD